MSFDAVRGYVQLAAGLGDLTRARATEAAQGLLSLPGAGGPGRLAGQVSSLADELLAAAVTNRSNLVALMRSEIDAAVLRLGLVRGAELEAAEARIAGLRSQVAELRASAAMIAADAAAAPVADPTDPVRPRRGVATSRRSRAETPATAKKATTKKATAKKATPSKKTAKKTTPAKTTAKKSALGKAPAKATPAKKSVPGKAPAKKATPAKKSVPAKRTAANRRAKG